LDRIENLAGRERVRRAAVDAHAPRAQRPAGFWAAHGDHGFLKEGQKNGGQTEAIGCRKKRARAHAGLEDRELRRPRLERAHQRGDRARIEVGQLGERRRVNRDPAAPLDHLDELPAEPALEDRDVLPPQAHLASRELASARRSTALRTSARVRWSCALSLNASSFSGSNSAITTAVVASTVASRGSSPPRM